MAALFNGQVINVAGIARETGVARTTVHGYLDILEDTLLVFRLPAYETRPRVRERRLPKLYWVDPGVVRAVKRQLGDVAAEERGPLLESWVVTTLRAHAETQELYDEIFYWSPHRANVEVDLLLQRGRELLAIEVKSTDRYHTGLLKGLRALDALPGGCSSTRAAVPFAPPTVSISGPLAASPRRSPPARSGPATGPDVRDPGSGKARSPDNVPAPVSLYPGPGRRSRGASLEHDFTWH